MQKEEYKEHSRRGGRITQQILLARNPEHHKKIGQKGGKWKRTEADKLKTSEAVKKSMDRNPCPYCKRLIGDRFGSKLNYKRHTTKCHDRQDKMPPPQGIGEFHLESSVGSGW